MVESRLIPIFVAASDYRGFGLSFPGLLCSFPSQALYKDAWRDGLFAAARLHHGKIEAAPHRQLLCSKTVYEGVRRAEPGSVDAANEPPNCLTPGNQETDQSHCVHEAGACGRTLRERLDDAEALLTPSASSRRERGQ